MIKLERTMSWYRPYTVVASGKEYILEAIKFYDKDGNIVASQSGWLENKFGNDIQSIELNTEKVTRRNKEKFDGEVFGTVFHSYNKTRLVLYIPMDMVNLTYVGRKKMYGDRVYEVYEGDQGIYVTKYVESLDKDLRVVQNEYECLLEKVDLYSMEKNPDETIEMLTQMIETVKRFKVERANIDSIIIDN